MRTSRGSLGLAVLGLMAALVQAAPLTQAAAATTDRAGRGAVAAAKPTTPPTGHFHALTAPKRVVSTLTGTGLAKKPLAKGAVKTLAVGGRAGIPSTHVRAVAVTLTAVSPKGATQLWAGPSATKPSVPSVATTGNTASAFAIVPLSSTGRMHLWNGAHPTGITVDVTGWFSGKSETGTAGLFNRLAGRTLRSATIHAGQMKTWTVRGVQDVPVTGLNTLLLRVHATTATAAGRLSVAPTAAATKPVTTLAYRKGATDDLAIGRVASDGTLVARNMGTKAVTVAIDAVGWFTKGGSATQFGDSLRLATPTNLLSRRTLGSSGATVTLAGAHGVPASSSTEPPSLVLMRALVDHPIATTAMTADPAKATATHLPAMSVKTNNVNAGLVLGQPGTNGRGVLATTKGTLRATAASYGWFAGGMRLSPDLHALSGPEISSIQSITSDAVTFSNAPASITGLLPDEVLSSGPTAKTPDGLLRKVVSVQLDTPSQGETQVNTSPGSLDEVILQGHVSAGAASPSSLKSAAQAAVHRTHRGRPAVLGTLGDCAVIGGPLGVGATVSCSHTFSKDGGSLEVDASAGVGLDMDVTWWHGLIPTHAHLAVQASASIGAQLSAGGSSDFNETYDLPHISLSGGEPVVIPAGEVPIVLFPYATPKIQVDGHIEAGVFANGEVDGTLRVDIDSSDGVSASQHVGHATDAGFTGDITPITVHPQFIPAVTIFFYENPWALTPFGGDPPEGGAAFENGGGIWAGFGLGPTLEIDSCTIQWSYQLSYHVGAVLLVFGHDLAGDLNHEFDLGSVSLPPAPWRNCAIWSGTFNFTSSLSYTAPDYSRSSSSTASMSIDPVDKPPTYGLYTISGSGSGRSDANGVISCGNGDAFIEKSPTEQLYTWGGSIVANGGGQLTVAINDGVDGGYVASLYPAGYDQVSAPWQSTLDTWTTNENGFCEKVRVEDSGTGWYQDVFNIFNDADAPPGGGTINFNLPPGQMTATGTAHVDGGNNTNVPDYNLSYSLTKTCMMGGTDC